MSGFSSRTLPICCIWFRRDARGSTSICRRSWSQSMAVVVVAVAGGLATEIGPWYEGLRFPALRPPNWLFGSGLDLDLRADRDGRRTCLGRCARQRRASNADRLVRAERPAERRLEPAVLQAEAAGLGAYSKSFRSGFDLRADCCSSRRFRRAPPACCAPYLAWVTFAGWFNWRIVRLNVAFGRATERLLR